jgi:hypothetical protein
MTDYMMGDPAEDWPIYDYLQVAHELGREFQQDLSPDSGSGTLTAIMNWALTLIVKQRHYHLTSSRISCEHWTLLKDLEAELQDNHIDSFLGYARPRFRRPAFNEHLFRDASDQLHEHIASCVPISDERMFLERGIAAYAQLLKEPENSAEARQWLRMFQRMLEHQLPDRRTAGAPVDPSFVPLIFHAATYLGAAGLGGIVGNRADAVVVDSVKHLFRSVHDQWNKRASSDQEALSREEAVDVVKAAALAHGYEPATFILILARQDEHQSWFIELVARLKTSDSHELLRARILPGDPAKSNIVIFRR